MAPNNTFLAADCLGATRFRLALFGPISHQSLQKNYQKSREFVVFYYTPRLKNMEHNIF